MVQLTPEERQRIYEEERVRREAQEQLKREAEDEERRIMRKIRLRFAVAFGVLAIVLAGWYIYDAVNDGATSVRYSKTPSPTPAPISPPKLADVSKSASASAKTEPVTPRPKAPQDKIVHRFVTIDDSGSARVLDAPPNGSLIGRIPSGKRVEFFDTETVRTGALSQTWYKVRWQGQWGWISQYTTTGDIDSETETGKRKSEKAAFQNDPLANRPRYDDEAASLSSRQEAFRNWALKTGGVTWVHFESDWQIWVTLSPEKYTTKQNVESIARFIARAYKQQVKIQKPVIVTVWNIDRTKYIAKGRSWE